MIIRQIVLNDYTLFRESDINKLMVDYSSPMQVILGSNGSGKAQRLDSMIKTPSGWSRMGDIKVGDYVTTPDGGKSPVTAVHPQGRKSMYRVYFEDGRWTDCCGDHLWKVYHVFWSPTSTRWRVMSLSEIMAALTPTMKKAGIFVPLPEPEYKEDIDLPIDPYLLGVVLGDAHISQNTVGICNPDKEIIDEVERLLPKDFTLRRQGETITYKVTKTTPYGRYERSTFLEIFRNLNLTGTHSYDKFIPDIYLEGSPAQRLALVQGLMDTDGYADKNGSVSFCTTSEKLAHQFQYLIRSLGGMCKIATKIPHYSHLGERRTGRLAYILNIRIKDTGSLFRLTRKKERAMLNTQYADRLRLRIVEIKPIGDHDAQCITIDHPDHLYITDDYIVTHNSSTLRQHSLFPAARPLFGKNGYRCLVIEHEGTYYKLESDYTKSSSPHSFYEGDNPEDLNIGGTTASQVELLEEKLGYTQFVDDVMMNRFTFPKWTASKRKEFLMAHNPDDIGFVLGLAKQTATKLRACKANLARLNSRKIILEQGLLSEEVLTAMEAEKLQVNQDLADFQKYLMNLEVGRKVLGDGGHADPSYTPHLITRELKKIRHQISLLQHVSRDPRERRLLRDQAAGTVAACDHQITTRHEEIQTLTNTLADLESRYQELTPDGDLGELTATVERLETLCDRLHCPPPSLELGRETLDSFYRDWEGLRERLAPFETCSVPLYPTVKRNRREQLRERLSYRLSSYEMKLGDLQHQYEEIAKRNTMSPKDIPDAPCAKNACPLYSHFMEGYENAEQRREQLLRRINLGKARLRRVSQVHGGLVRYFEESKPYHDLIAWLIDQARANPVLHTVLRGIDVLQTLRHSPNIVSIRLKDAYDRHHRWLDYKEALKDLETAKSLRDKLIGSQDRDTVELVVTLDNTRKALRELQSGIQGILDKKALAQKTVFDLETFETLTQRVKTIRDLHVAQVEHLSQTHEADRLSFLTRKVKELQNQAFLRMGELERTLRDQLVLQASYQEEIVNQIAQIETELTELEQIEKALVKIPKDSTIDFVNAIFTQANAIIASVWTVPFEIEMVDYDAPLTYDFKVTGDNQSSRELSECSEGQTEILTLAINLALRMELGHTDLPLCLDECGRTLDETHKHNLVKFMRRLLEDRIVSQLYLVSHMAIIHESFASCETLVLRSDNVVVPSKYNDHATIS